ncbi:hypothetical protein C8R47DRAFT_1328793 [Mycena vitilis]|nr:hypothetical protein C8R47DRAFT_1329024 [Mycena vitilis]KAJ6456002.1 hypothetical protein C8R47DRAFT_1328793 [Mycena vitilis]
MAELFIGQPSGDTEAMYREIIAGPNVDDYLHIQCPNGFPHRFLVDLGDANPIHAGSIQLVCDGYQYGYLLLDYVPPKRCDTQQGPLLSVEDWRRFVKLRDEFRPLNNKLHHLWDLVMKTRDALAAISGEQFPPLPPKMAELTSELVNDVADALESLAPYHVPREPNVLNYLVKGKGKESAWPVRSMSPLFEEDDSKYNEDGLVPDVDTLETVHPAGSKLLHLVIHYAQYTLPLHIRCWTADPTSFIVAAYDFPGIGPASELLVYRVADEQFCPATDPLNVAGDIVVCRRFDVPETGCAWLKRWTQRARDQAAAAPVPAGLQHRQIGATAAEASEPEKKRRMVPHSVGGTPEAAGPSKRRRMDEDEEVAPAPIALSKLDKLRALDEKIKTHGFPDQAPLSLASSDFESEVDIFSLPPSDDVVSSDVEVL